MPRTTVQRPGRRNRTSLAALGAATAGLALAAFGAPAVAFGAGPTEVTYDTGSLDWGVKQSFRSYVTGPAGQGSIELTGGATRNADGTFRFGFGSARYDLGSHTLSAAFTGGVRFLAHGGQLDVGLSDLRLTTSGTTGTLTADTASKEQVGAPQATERQDVPLATFTVGRDTTTGAATPARLTEEGAKVFAGFYPAGSDLDPLSLLLARTPAPSPSPSPSPSAPASPSASASPTATGSPSSTGSPSATGSPTATGSPSATASPSATGSPSASGSPTVTTPATGELAVVDGRLDWTVKESFRKYLAGPVANGKAEFGGGAADYRFGGATGTYHTGTHAVSAGFAGSVRFLGHPSDGGYALDTTFDHFGLRIDKDGAFLTADVNAKSPDGRTSVLTGARIAKLDLSGAAFAPVGGVVTLTAVPATLTAEGVPAFGNYPAGEALDAVTVSLSFDRNARVPAGSGTGTGGAAGTGASVSSTGLGGGAVLASTGSGTPVVPLLATAAGLLLAGGGTTVLVRRRTGSAGA
ncbi:hypothetical protein GCM10010495_34730 [Kitasatospora herbaricolor]|uniref:HtaA domain-containing protein n=1 Tax=Kitasatospora herbaricolor TaxID=68217 RepID=UPI00174B320F|nr:HtaA domain-containing protein [Kitasatospora herbaricolor]MDQ0310017.1 hypothetical protein [Kitasatospora herbaricolor]GGV17418.1 hypothetical protein GCM10010495_34730 [Kitasatospora herbaricolor]